MEREKFLGRRLDRREINDTKQNSGACSEGGKRGKLRSAMKIRSGSTESKRRETLSYSGKKKGVHGPETGRKGGVGKKLRGKALKLERKSIWGGL